MEDIKESTKDSMKKVASFSEKSQKIGDVLGMIKEIASETHLLALNASIEASSAGNSANGLAWWRVRCEGLRNEQRRMRKKLKMSFLKSRCPPAPQFYLLNKV